jgi:GT2 family glycosyltransferase
MLPFSAIFAIDPPKDIFYFYFDDFEYMSRIEKSGYTFYVVKKPIITDVDSSFSNNTNSTKSFFDLHSNVSKVYYYSRNRVLLRRIAKTQNIISLFFNSFVWIIGQVIYGFFLSKNKKHWLKISNILFKGFKDAFCVKI